MCLKLQPYNSGDSPQLRLLLREQTELSLVTDEWLGKYD